MANIISGYDAAQLISEAGGGKSEKNVRNLADSGTIGRVQNAEGKVLGYDRDSVERYVADLRQRGQTPASQPADHVAAAPIADLPEYLRELLHQNATATERVLELSSQLADARVKIVMLEAELRGLRARRRTPAADAVDDEISSTPKRVARKPLRQPTVTVEEVAQPAAEVNQPVALTEADLARPRRRKRAASGS